MKEKDRRTETEKERRTETGNQNTPECLKARWRIQGMVYYREFCEDSHSAVVMAMQLGCLGRLQTA